MANGITLPANIEQARTGAQTLAQKAGELTSGQYTVGDVLKQKALDAYGASQDIVKPLDVATQEYLTAPQVAREKYADVFDPFARERLTAQYTGQQALPMLSLASILGQRFGRVEDVIGAGTRAYQAQTSAAQQAAQLGRQSYTDLLSEYQLIQQLAQQQWQRQQDELEAQRDLEQQLWQRQQAEEATRLGLEQQTYERGMEEQQFPLELELLKAQVGRQQQLAGGGSGGGGGVTPTQSLDEIWERIEAETTYQPSEPSSLPLVGWSTPSGITTQQPGTSSAWSPEGPSWAERY